MELPLLGIHPKKNSLVFWIVRVAEGHFIRRKPRRRELHIGDVSRKAAKAQRRTNMTENEVAKCIVNAAYHIHTSLGPGLLESVYEEVLSYELRKRGLVVTRQKSLPIQFEDLHIQDVFRVDSERLS